VDLQHDLENRTEQAAREAARAGKQLFMFLIKAEADILKGAFNFAAFIPKQVIAGLAEKSDKVYKGKQSIKTLIGSGAKLENIPLDKDKTAIFDSVARKYGIDYSMQKAATPQPDGQNKTQCLLFFKSKDINVLTAAFKEFTAKVVDNERKKSVKERVNAERGQNREEKRDKNRERKREKKKTREEIL